MNMKKLRDSQHTWREDFPILQQRTSQGARLAYLDNGATSQKPQVVLDAIRNYYQEDNANVHRGVYELSARATEAYESARSFMSSFLGAARSEEIIFVRGATEAINLVAQSYLLPNCKPQDEIILSVMEHHANIVPWQVVANEKNLRIRVVPIDEAGNLDMKTFYGFLNEKTKMVALTHISNVLGTVNPISEIVQASHKVGAKVLIDGAQAAPHMPVDVRDLGVDFYTFSGHKTFGPTGIGVLYAPYDLLASMVPYQTGGSMIERVSFAGTTYATPPLRFEAGTPNISGAVGMAEACRYIEEVGYDAIQQHEHKMLQLMEEVFASFPKITTFGHSVNKVAMVSFVYEDVHAHDVATILDAHGVAVRAGHHCCMPLIEHFGVPATTRASLAFYNDENDIHALQRGLHAIREMFDG